MSIIIEIIMIILKIVRGCAAENFLQMQNKPEVYVCQGSPSVFSKIAELCLTRLTLEVFT